MSAVYTFAIGLYVLKTTGSGLSFAVTLSLQILPTVLLAPLAGVLADRLNKKALVIATDAFGGALFIALYLTSGNGLTLRAVYAATLLLSVSQTLYNVCVDAAVPDLVSARRVPTLNSIGKIADSAASMLSPALGGILYAAVDIRLFVLLNAAAFVLSTLSECLIDFRLYAAPHSPAGKFSPARDLAEGFRVIRKTEWMRSALLNFLLINFFVAVGYSVPVPYILNHFYGLPSEAYGTIQCFMPAGMIAGALLAKRIAARVPFGRLTAVTGICCSLCLSLSGMLPALRPHAGQGLTVPYYSFVLFCAGLIITLIDVPFINNFQLRVPEEYRGRSLSISVSAVKVFAPAGYILSGGLLGITPVFFPPLCGGALLLLSAVAVNRRLLFRRFHPGKRRGAPPV